MNHKWRKVFRLLDVACIPANTFTSSEEWLQAEIRHKTHHLQLNVTFPELRHCQDAYIQQRKHNQSRQLHSECFTRLPDNRQIVTWGIKDIEPYKIYTLLWKW